MNAKYFFGVAAATVLASAWSGAAPVVLQDGLSGYAGTDDTFLFQNYTGLTTGGLANLNVGGWVGGAGSTAERTLIRFDLSSLAGQTITSASLTLTSTGQIVDHDWSDTLTVYRVSDANKAWVGGTGYANPPGSNGTATWGNLSENDVPASAVPWAGSAGLMAAGTDYVATPLATAAISSTDAIGTQYTLTFADAAFLNVWASNPSNNAGFLLVLPGGELSRMQEVSFASAQADTGSIRPELSLTVPEPMSIGLLGASLVFMAGRRRRMA